MAKNKWKQRNNAPVVVKEHKVEEGTVEQLLVEFDAWFAARASMIPKQHHKEILRVDFKARGVGPMATMEEFDDALGKYGIKLE